MFRQSSSQAFVVLCLWCLAWATQQQHATADSPSTVPSHMQQQHETATESSPSHTSCVGVRSTYIDKAYCEAVYDVTTCDFWEHCYTEISASCSSTCEAAGCECTFQPRNCTDGDGDSCGQYACLPPEDPVHVGSCAFLRTKEGCEKVIGCSWEGYDTTGVVTNTELQTSSSVSGVGIALLILIIIFGLMFYR